MKGKTVFGGGHMSVQEVHLRMGGKRLTRYRVITNDSAVVIPFLDDDTVLMEKQYRFTVEGDLLEFPAGLVEKGEKPIDTARRELEEETGYRAKRVEFLFYAYPSPGVKVERAYYFVAHGLTRTRTSLDEGERIRVLRIKVGNLLRMIREGRIHDTKSVALALYYLYRKSYLVAKR